MKRTVVLFELRKKGVLISPLKFTFSADSEVVMAERWAHRVSGTGPKVLEMFQDPMTLENGASETAMLVCKCQDTTGGRHTWASILWTLVIWQQLSRISLQCWELLSDQCPQAGIATFYIPGRILRTTATRLSALSYWALASPELLSDEVIFLSLPASLPPPHESHHQDKASGEGSC